MVWSANSYQEAYFWTKTDVAWPFLIALFLQFTLVFTQSKFLKSRLTYLLLYVPAALIAITGFFTQWLSGTPTLTNWGYQEGSPATLANILSSAWAIAVPALACTLCFRYYLQAEDTNQKKQRLLVAVGITIPSVAYAATSTMFSLLQIDVPNIGHLSLMFFGIFVGFAIVKHDLFKFDAAMAAENIISTIPDPLILTEQSGKMLRVNGQLSSFLGYNETELVGKSLKELFDKGNNQPIDFITDLADGKMVGKRELVCWTKTGEKRTILLSGSAVRSKTGRVAGFVCVLHDITSRKKMEQALREAEARYHALFDQAPVGVLVVDPETAAFVEFNDVVCKQLGYSREEFAALTVPKIEAQETVDDVKSHAAQMVKEGGGEFETKHRTKDGKIRSVLVSTRTFELAGKKLLHCIFHDITEIRRVQDALMESETRYRQLVELAQEGIWVLDREYNTTFVNHRMSQMMGYAGSEMVGKSLFEFVDKAHVEQAKKALSEYAQGVRGDFQYEFTRKDGSRVYTSIMASQVTDDEGRYLGTLALVADITLRKQMADKLEQYSKHLEDLVAQRTKQLSEAQGQLVKAERLAAIGELAGMVGHDLRNPLTGIKNAAYFLEKKGAEIPVEQSRAMLKTIDRCVEHSNKIINDLLDYSREIHLELHESSPIKLLSEALAVIQIPEKVKILNHLADEPLKIDPDKIERVFINLIKNAIDAMPNGGTVTINSKKLNCSIQISVTDTGTGIPDEILPKLFSPLFTTKAQGMGFGLAICKRIVEAHEGKITVETAKGKGTTFTVTLPVEAKPKVRGDKFWINPPESSLLTTTKA
jgi:PAS domain S-box-containing protein